MAAQRIDKKQEKERSSASKVEEKPTAVAHKSRDVDVETAIAEDASDDNAHDGDAADDDNDGEFANGGHSSDDNPRDGDAADHANDDNDGEFANGDHANDGDAPDGDAPDDDADNADAPDNDDDRADSDGSTANDDSTDSDGDASDDDNDAASNAEAPPPRGNGNAQHAAPPAHDNEIAHVVPLPTLGAVFGVLVALTVATVAVTSIDFGSTANLIVAMVIATIKAGLVIAVFMHLLYDRSINLLLFLTSVLFVILFISLSMIDRAEYQPSIDELEAVKAAESES